MSNAKITITVPYDQIPNEVEILVQTSMTRLEGVIECMRLKDFKNFQKILEEIETARKKLILVDANLEDAYNILLGYLKNEVDIKLAKEMDTQRVSNES